MPMFRADLYFSCGPATNTQQTFHQVYVEASVPRECTAKALAYLRQHHADKIQGLKLTGDWNVPTPGIGAPGLRLKRSHRP